MSRIEVTSYKGNVRSVLLVEEAGLFSLKIENASVGVVELFQHAHPPTRSRKEADRQFDFVVAAWRGAGPC